MNVGIADTSSSVAIESQSSTSTLRNLTLGYLVDKSAKNGEIALQGPPFKQKQIELIEL